MAHAAHPAGGKPGTPGDSVTAQGPAGGAPAAGPQAHPKTVLEAAEINRALTRIAHEIIERTRGAEQVVLLGIPTRGVPLAERLAARITQVEGRPVPHGSLDITMYRDDLRLRPARRLGPTEVPAEGIDGKTVVLVDDVLYSGPDRARRPRRAQRPRPPARRAARRAGRPRAPRAADPGRLRGQEPADLTAGGGPGPAHRDRRRGRGAARTGRHRGAAPAGAESPGGDDEPAPHLSRRPEQAGRAADTGHRRGTGPGGGPAHQEAAHAARAHRREPVLRGLHQDPDLVRGGGQAAVRRCDQLRGQGLERGQGGKPQGHRAHPGGHGLRRRGRPAQRLGCAAPAGGLGAGQRDQRR